jgi:ketosteroid isomerase-like protein
MIARRLLLVAGLLLAAAAPRAAELPAGVAFEGVLEPAASPRGAWQRLILNLASAWAACDPTLLEATLTPDVDFSYPTTRHQGRDLVVADLEQFCAQAEDTSFYFPADAFYIDEPNGRIAAEVQFRTTQRGARQVVNDVWIATVRDGKLAVVKEYLDGRVRHLQAQGVLTLEESPPFLTPWPPRTEAWQDCFPIVKSEPTNRCPAE